MRKRLVALAAVSAFVSVLAPGTASAAPDWEVDYGVKGTPPADVVCANQMDKAWVCYERGGDRWWVRDNAQDGMSALVQWYNFRDGSLYRRGRCINSHEAGTWASCNKNYYEDSRLTGFQGAWDRGEEGSVPVFYETEWQFQ